MNLMNKNISFLMLITMALMSCKSDNFYDTKRCFKTDKNEYVIGKKILLTAIIRPVAEIKTIRFYDNYSNIELSFALINSETEMHNSRWTERTGRNLPKSKTNEIPITKEEPFTKQFVLNVIEESDSIILTITELNYKT